MRLACTLLPLAFVACGGRVSAGMDASNAASSGGSGAADAMHSGGNSGTSDAASSGGTTNTDANMVAQDADSAVSSDTCGRRTDVGDLICCGIPSEIPGFSCVDLTVDGGEYGVYGRCIDSGESFDGKIAGAQCCEGMGLVEIGSEVELSDGTCGYVGPLSDRYCTPCGDGTCGALENHCNCPDDCGPGETPDSGT